MSWPDSVWLTEKATCRYVSTANFWHSYDSLAADYGGYRTKWSKNASLEILIATLQFVRRRESTSERNRNTETWNGFQVSRPLNIAFHRKVCTLMSSTSKLNFLSRLFLRYILTVKDRACPRIVFQTLEKSLNNSPSVFTFLLNSHEAPLSPCVLSKTNRAKTLIIFPLLLFPVDGTFDYFKLIVFLLNLLWQFFPSLKQLNNCLVKTRIFDTHFWRSMNTLCVVVVAETSKHPYWFCGAFSSMLKVVVIMTCQWFLWLYNFWSDYWRLRTLRSNLAMIFPRGPPTNILTVPKVSVGGLWTTSTFSWGRFLARPLKSTQNKIIATRHPIAKWWQ